MSKSCAALVCLFTLFGLSGCQSAMPRYDKVYVNYPYDIPMDYYLHLGEVRQVKRSGMTPHESRNPEWRKLIHQMELPKDIDRSRAVKLSHGRHWQIATDQPVCQRQPRFFLDHVSHMWMGPLLYGESFGGQSSAQDLLSTIDQLVELNCAAGTVESVLVYIADQEMAKQLGYRKFNRLRAENGLPPAPKSEIYTLDWEWRLRDVYADEFNTTKMAPYAGLYDYSGSRKLIHLTPETAENHKRAYAATYAARERGAAYQRARAENQSSLKGWCGNNPVLCIAVPVIAFGLLSGSGSSGEPGATFNGCDRCYYESDEDERSLCLATCPR